MTKVTFWSFSFWQSGWDGLMPNFAAYLLMPTALFPLVYVAMKGASGPRSEWYELVRAIVRKLALKSSKSAKNGFSAVALLLFILSALAPLTEGGSLRNWAALLLYAEVFALVAYLCSDAHKWLVHESPIRLEKWFRVVS